MLAPLDRTAVLCRDVAEQPVLPYIVILGNSNLIVTATHVAVHEGRVDVYADTDLVLSFANNAKEQPWSLVARDRCEILTREQQLRRRASVATAETVLWKEIKPAEELVEDTGESIVEQHRSGQYL
jgi:hypothetical protein